MAKVQHYNVLDIKELLILHTGTNHFEEDKMALSLDATDALEKSSLELLSKSSLDFATPGLSTAVGPDLRMALDQEIRAGEKRSTWKYALEEACRRDPKALFMGQVYKLVEAELEERGLAFAMGATISLNHKCAALAPFREGPFHTPADQAFYANISEPMLSKLLHRAVCAPFTPIASSSKLQGFGVRLVGLVGGNGFRSQVAELQFDVNIKPHLFLDALRDATQLSVIPPIGFELPEPTPDPTPFQRERARFNASNPSSPIASNGSRHSSKSHPFQRAHLAIEPVPYAQSAVQRAPVGLDATDRLLQIQREALQEEEAATASKDRRKVNIAKNSSLPASTHPKGLAQSAPTQDSPQIAELLPPSPVNQPAPRYPEHLNPLTSAVMAIVAPTSRNTLMCPIPRNTPTASPLYGPTSSPLPRWTPDLTPYPTDDPRDPTKTPSPPPAENWIPWWQPETSSLSEPRVRDPGGYTLQDGDWLYKLDVAYSDPEGRPSLSPKGSYNEHSKTEHYKAAQKPKMEEQQCRFFQTEKKRREKFGLDVLNYEGDSWHMFIQTIKDAGERHDGEVIWIEMVHELDKNAMLPHEVEEKTMAIEASVDMEDGQTEDNTTQGHEDEFREWALTAGWDEQEIGEPWSRSPDTDPQDYAHDEALMKRLMERNTEMARL